MNVNKMRRHMAKSTPDVIQRRFDFMLDEYQKQYYAWVMQFKKRMEVKHGKEKPVRIDVFMDTDAAQFPGEAVIWLRYITEEK